MPTLLLHTIHLIFDTSSQGSRSPTLLLHQMLYLRHLLKQLLLLHQLLRLLVLPHLQNLPTPSSPHGLPCRQTYITSTNQFSPSKLECLMVTMRLYMETHDDSERVFGPFHGYMENSRITQSPQCITVCCMFISNLFVSCVFYMCVKLYVDVMFGIMYFMCNVVNFISTQCICLSVCAFVSLSVYKSF